MAAEVVDMVEVVVNKVEIVADIAGVVEIVSWPPHGPSEGWRKQLSITIATVPTWCLGVMCITALWQQKGRGDADLLDQDWPLVRGIAPAFQLSPTNSLESFFDIFFLKRNWRLMFNFQRGNHHCSERSFIKQCLLFCHIFPNKWVTRCQHLLLVMSGAATPAAV